MKKRVILHKKRGETPLHALTAWKNTHPSYTDIPASYAGRLDPMAEGKLLVLLGDECKRQKRYHNLDKEYVVEVLLDVGSDTGDALGLITYSNTETRVDTKTLEKILHPEKGKAEHAYPAFSSKTVGGKPLFLYALEGTLDTIQIPTHQEEIYDITLQGVMRLSETELRTRIDAFLADVPTTTEPSKSLGADFRIQEVRASWNELFTAAKRRTFALITIKVTCGTGTYMRSLAPRIGKALHTDALALSIRRTRIGKRWFGFFIDLLA